MQRIIHSPPLLPAVLARYQAVLRSIRAADLTEAQADTYWDRTHHILDQSLVQEQCQALNVIQAEIRKIQADVAQ